MRIFINVILLWGREERYRGWDFEEFLLTLRYEADCFENYRDGMRHDGVSGRKRRLVQFYDRNGRTRGRRIFEASSIASTPRVSAHWLFPTPFGTPRCLSVFPFKATGGAIKLVNIAAVFERLKEPRNEDARNDYDFHIFMNVGIYCAKISVSKSGSKPRILIFFSLGITGGTSLGISQS